MYFMLKENDRIPAGLQGILVTSDDAKNSGPGKTVKLSELDKDKYLILYFYPKDMTPGCTIETSSFGELDSDIRKAGGTIVGCSRDNVSSHCKFISNQKISFSLLTDDTEQITAAFGVWQKKKMYGKEYMGIHRSTFITHKGKIIKVFDKVKPAEHPAEVLAFLKTLP